MSDRGFPTPEQAALAGYGLASKARIIAVSVAPGGDHAAVLVDTEPSHPYEVICENDGHDWYERSGSNACSGGTLDDETGRRFRTFWHEVPEDATHVRVNVGEMSSEVPASEGWFLWADWSSPDDETLRRPRVVAQRVGGKWIDVAPDPSLERLEQLLRDGPSRGWRHFVPWRWVRQISRK